MVDQVKATQNDMISGKVLSREPGIVVFSPSLEVLYLNCHAQFLFTNLDSAIPEAQQANYRTGAFPPALINLAGEIIRVLRSRHEMGEKGELEIRRSANGFGKSVRIRGLGVPNGHGIEHARIVLVLTEVNASHSENH